MPDIYQEDLTYSCPYCGQVYLHSRQARDCGCVDERDREIVDFLDGEFYQKQEEAKKCAYCEIWTHYWEIFKQLVLCITDGLARKDRVICAKCVKEREEK